MEKFDLIYLIVLLIALGICIVGLINTNIKPIEPKEKMPLIPCECVSECLQDFREYNTTNYFTIARHRSFNFETRDCAKLTDKIKTTCCWGWEE